MTLGYPTRFVGQRSSSLGHKVQIHWRRSSGRCEFAPRSSAHLVYCIVFACVCGLILLVLVSNLLILLLIQQKLHWYALYNLVAVLVKKSCCSCLTPSPVWINRAWTFVVCHLCSLTAIYQRMIICQYDFGSFFTFCCSFALCSLMKCNQ